jgi:hypothetical protein
MAASAPKKQLGRKPNSSAKRQFALTRMRIEAKEIPNYK